jgi:adenylosuccinate lyase
MPAQNAQDRYESPLVSRNASPAMAALFSPRKRIQTWRRLWIALAEAQRELGLKITARQISAMKRALDDIDFKRAARYEKELRHDVMAHVHTFADAAPPARPIIHLGATSAFVVDNADLVIMRDALERIRDWLVNAIDALGTFAATHADLPTLGFTHFQPAQPTTVGKRATLWCYEFVMDLERVDFELSKLRFRGAKGATGTQASFLSLFDNRVTMVTKLDRLVASKLGFSRAYPVVGQTNSRKVDAYAVNTLAGVASSVHRFSNDIRLLSHLKEVEEPFGKKQIGSSAMAYKRNPMRCERATGLARFVMSLATSPLATAAEQWFERTLDDSANKRLSVPEAFLATDGMLILVTEVARNMVVYPQTITARLNAELPFIASEQILMEAVKRGGDRQALHETIRRHSVAAAREVKEHGRRNDLIDRLGADPDFGELNLTHLLDPARHVGLAPRQTRDFIRSCVMPIRRRHKKVLGWKTDLKV